MESCGTSAIHKILQIKVKSYAIENNLLKSSTVSLLGEGRGDNGRLPIASDTVEFTFPCTDYPSLITKGNIFNMIDKRLEYALEAALFFHPLILDSGQTGCNSNSLSPLEVQSGISHNVKTVIFHILLILFVSLIMLHIPHLNCTDFYFFFV